MTLFSVELPSCDTSSSYLPVCCMFFVSHKIHIKRSPNGIKTYRDFFGIYVNFGKWNQCETMPEGAHEGPGRACPPGACPLPRGPLGHRLTLILLPKNHIYSKIILRKFLSRLDFVLYGYSTKQKTCNNQELALGTGSIR